jgi:hypothetical protein
MRRARKGVLFFNLEESSMGILPNRREVFKRASF